MLNLVKTAPEKDKILTSTLLSSARITPDSSREEVWQLTFRANDGPLGGAAGNCIRVMAPGQYGNKYHVRLYSIADQEQVGDSQQYSLCVRRCSYIDDFNGEEYPGVASNFLCNLKPGALIEHSGPVGYPFDIPGNPNADLLMIGMGTGIAPFRWLMRTIYEKQGGWQGKVRLFHGGKTGLDLLYQNDANNDLAYYFDQPTFKAIQALSPRPAFDAPAALDKALEQNSKEVWEIINSPDSRVFVAGANQMMDSIDKTMATMAGSPEAWSVTKEDMVASGRWAEILY